MQKRKKQVGRKIRNIVIGVVVWCAITAYLLFATTLCGEQREKLVVDKVVIEVVDGAEVSIVSPKTVREWLDDQKVYLEGNDVEKVNTKLIEDVIESQCFVKEAQAFVGLNGVLTVRVEQRVPIVRVVTSSGYDFYVSDDMWVLPAVNTNTQHVTMVSGEFAMPFPKNYSGKLDQEQLEGEEKKSLKNYAFLVNLIKFVEFVNADDFWRAEIVQIHVNDSGSGSGRSGWREPEVEIIPRVGSHVVELGTLDGYEMKLEKLLKFYRNVLDFEGWDKYKYISIKYNNQVVCR